MPTALPRPLVRARSKGTHLRRPLLCLVALVLALLPARVLASPDPPGAPLALEVQMGDVTYTVTGAVASGLYADGVPYVVAPQGAAVTIAEPAVPGPRTENGVLLSGSEINPQRGSGRGDGVPSAGGSSAQGYDARVDSYEAARTATWPAQLQAGDIVVTAVSRPDLPEENGVRQGIIASYAALHVVAEAPPADAFSPAATGWTGRGTPQHHRVDLDAALAALPSYPVAGMDVVPVAEVFEHFDQFVPIGGQSLAPVWSRGGYEVLFPYRFGDGGNYGRESAHTVGAAGLHLIGDAATPEEKRRLLVRMIQHGIQWYDPTEGADDPVEANGGHFQFWLTPAAIALRFTGRSADIEALPEVMPGNAFGQSFFMTPELVAQLVPHDDPSAPYIWRRRTLAPGSVSGNEITVRFNSRLGDGKASVKQLLLTRERDGATASVLGVSSTLVSGEVDRVITIDAQPAEPFAPGDVVYFDAPFPIRVGDVDWIERGVKRGAFRGYNPSPYAGYRNIAEWGDDWLVIKALGLMRPSFAPFDAYTKRAAEPANPTAAVDYPMVLASMNKRRFTEDFWRAHWQAIDAVPQTGGTDVPLTLADFSRDRALFDSGAHLGRDAAAVPLSGTGAPGAAVEARVVTEAGVPVTAWAPLATAGADGRWAATLSAPRHAAWLRPEVRPAADPTAVRTTAHRFGSGHVWALWGQSEVARLWSGYGSQTPPVPVPDDEAVQMIWHDASSGAGADGVRHHHVTDADPHTAAFAAMAATLSALRPGEKFALVHHTVPGTDFRSLMNEGDDRHDRRPWPNDQALHAYATADGQQIGVAAASWFASPGSLGSSYGEVFYAYAAGRRLDGSPLTIPGDNAIAGGTYHLDHSWAELYDYAHTRWVPYGPHRFDITGDMRSATQVQPDPWDASETYRRGRFVAYGGRLYRSQYDGNVGQTPSGTAASTDAWAHTTDTPQYNLRNKERARQSWRALSADPRSADVFLPAGLEPLAYQNGFRHADGSWTDLTHPAPSSEDGVPRLARLTALALAQGAGLTDLPVPTFDEVRWTTAYVELGSSAGPITTARAARGEAPLGDAFPHWTDVLGFEIDGQIVHRAELVDGRVRVYPVAGPIVEGETALTFGGGGATGGAKHPEDHFAGIWKNVALADVGAPGLEGISVRPILEPLVAEGVTAPQEDVTLVLSGDGRRYVREDGLDGAVGATKLMLVFDGRIDGGRLFKAPGIEILPSGNELPRVPRLLLKDDAGQTVLDVRAATPRPGRAETLVSWDPAANRLQVYVDDASDRASYFRERPGTPAFGGDGPAVVAAGSPSGSWMTGELNRFALWIGTSLDLSVAANREQLRSRTSPLPGALVDVRGTADYYEAATLLNRGSGGDFERWPQTAGLRADQDELPETLRVRAAPNPAQGRAVLAFDLPTAGAVRLEVFDVLGRLVATVAEGTYEPGRYEATLDASALPVGPYLYRLSNPDGVRTGQLTIVR